jgi:phosphohistidine swiveling domain-containing protein
MRLIGTRMSSHDRWTRANIGEVVPERMTPFSFGVWSEPMNRLLALSFRHFGFDTDRYQFIRSDDGWLTYNIGVVNHLSREIGLPPMDAAVGTASGVTSDGALRWLALLRHSRGLARSTWGQIRLGRRYEEARVSAVEVAERYREAAAETEDPEHLIALAYQAYGELERFLALYADATAAAFSTYVLLERAVARFAPGVYPPSLLRSPGVTVSGVADALVRAARELGGAPADAAAGEVLAGFLHDFGHRGWQELELANPTWNTDPSAVLAIAERYRDAAGRRVQADLEVPGTSAPGQQLPPGWRGALLRAIALRAGEYGAIRENVKHEFYRPIDVIRSLVQKAAGRLAAAGRLETDRDMFFLTPDELTELLSFHSARALRLLAAERRADWDRPQGHGEVPAGEASAGAAAGGAAADGAAAGAAAAGGAAAGGEPEPARRPLALRGAGASPGEAAGTARVLRGPSDAVRLAPGDILVVEALDIGWTPVFALVGGTIGGVLTHACTVAREMGVPVVAGVRSSQTLIRDGDHVRIDGSTGEVELLTPVLAAQAPGAGLQ